MSRRGGGLLPCERSLARVQDRPPWARARPRLGTSSWIGRDRIGPASGAAAALPVRRGSGAPPARARGVRSADAARCPRGSTGGECEREARLAGVVGVREV